MMTRWLVLALVFGCAACASSRDDPFIALARKCDAAPSASNCAAAGNYLLEHGGKNLRACKTDLAVACRRDNEDSAAAMRRLDKLALEYHDRACLFGDGDACNKAGVGLAVEFANASQADAPEFARQAEERFQKACKLGVKEGCRNATSMRAR